jgi:hypothetical protein
MCRDAIDINKDVEIFFKKYINAWFDLRNTSLGPISAFIGGVVAQEVIKAITHKFIPIDQEIYFDFFELYEGP